VRKSKPLDQQARRAIAQALQRLSERAGHEVPDDGPFEPIVERSRISHPLHPVDAVILRIGPGRGDGERRRFLDVRVATASGGSDSSSWLHFAPKAELLALLAEEATGIEAVLAAVESSIESLHRFELK
jgi:hypothetical protein